MEELNKIVVGLGSRSILDDIGLTMTCPAGVGEAEGSDAPLALEDEWCQQLGSTSVHLIFQRFKSMSWHAHDVPGLLAGVCSKRLEVLANIKKLQRAADWMDKQAGRWWAVRSKRCSFKLWIVKKL